MHKVAGPDAAFLSAERPEWHFHVSALVRLDTAASDRFGFDAVRDTLARRIHRLPQFRWKLRESLPGILRPVWIDDDSFDLDWHLNHVALPPPGDDRALGRLVGRLVSTKIDRSRPLWEMWLIDGLEDGGTALLAKVHHSLVDGESGVELATLLFDFEPGPEPDPDPPAWEPEPTPGDVEVIGHALVDSLEWPRRVGQVVRQFADQGRTYAEHSFGPGRTTHPFQAPRTPFNGPLTPSRGFANASISLDDAKAIKNAFGVKLNDVVMAVVDGALRSYLVEVDQLPAGPLVAQVPVSMRRDEANADHVEANDHVGTKVSMMFAAMATHVADPLERLQAIHDSTTAAKEMRSAMSAQRIMNLTDTTPPGLISLAARAWTAAGLDGAAPPVFNVIVSNVPGPPFDLYMAGARITAMYPMGPLLFGSGVNFTVVSNASRLDIGILVCPDLLPDPWDLAERIGDAMAELTELVPDPD